MILAGRRINDNMGSVVADQVLKLMTKKDIHIKNANILIMGLAFKENCPDIRNTRVVDLVEEFKCSNCIIDVYDPWVNQVQAMDEYDEKRNIANKKLAVSIALSNNYRLSYQIHKDLDIE